MDPIYTVSSLTAHLQGTLEREYGSLWVEGEVSGLKAAPSGHAYFALKEGEQALLQCVCWRSQLTRLSLRLENGIQIVAHGRLAIYPPRGQYQLVVDAARFAGLGALQQRFEQLKRQLAAEGLFDAARKRPLPALPRRIGVVTSPQGAAIRDFLRVLERRFAQVHVMIVPSQVQGARAAAEIVAGISLLNRLGEVDVIVLTRGGGSIEDLWPFNEEIVARAIAASRIPVVSAVGHEVDFTSADFVADFRAATPTAAAEQLLPDKGELLDRIRIGQRRIVQRLHRQLDLLHERLLSLQLRLDRAGPRTRIGELRQTIGNQVARTIQALRGRIAHLRALLAPFERQIVWAQRTRVAKLRSDLCLLRERQERQGRAVLVQTGERLRALQQRLTVLAPEHVLRRGFAVCTTEDGRVVRRVADVCTGEHIEVGLADGRIGTTVNWVAESES